MFFTFGIFSNPSGLLKNFNKVEWVCLLACLLPARHVPYYVT